MDKFIVMMEWVENIDNLNLSQKGKLFQAFIDFNKTGKVEIKDKLVNMMWGFIEPNVIRMSNKYKNDVSNGKKGGRPKKVVTPPKKVIDKIVQDGDFNIPYQEEILTNEKR